MAKYFSSDPTANPRTARYFNSTLMPNISEDIPEDTETKKEIKETPNKEMKSFDDIIVLETSPEIPAEPKSVSHYKRTVIWSSDEESLTDEETHKDISLVYDSNKEILFDNGDQQRAQTEFIDSVHEPSVRPKICNPLDVDTTRDQSPQQLPENQINLRADYFCEPFDDYDSEDDYNYSEQNDEFSDDMDCIPDTVHIRRNEYQDNKKTKVKTHWPPNVTGFDDIVQQFNCFEDNELNGHRFDPFHYKIEESATKDENTDTEEYEPLNCRLEILVQKSGHESINSLVN